MFRNSHRNRIVVKFLGEGPQTHVNSFTPLALALDRQTSSRLHSHTNKKHKTKKKPRKMSAHTTAFKVTKVFSIIQFILNAILGIMFGTVFTTTLICAHTHCASTSLCLPKACELQPWPKTLMLLAGVKSRRGLQPDHYEKASVCKQCGFQCTCLHCDVLEQPWPKTP